MKIKEITYQHRRDFTATMLCEHCNHECINKYGYDDDNYHQNVIPAMKCPNCGKISSDTYRPLKTKYKAWEVV